MKNQTTLSKSDLIARYTAQVNRDREMIPGLQAKDRHERTRNLTPLYWVRLCPTMVLEQIKDLQSILGPGNPSKLSEAILDEIRREIDGRL